MAWTNETKHSATFTNQSQNSATFDTGLYFLLTELLGYILQENNGKIILDQSTNYIKPIVWVEQSKS